MFFTASAFAGLQWDDLTADSTYYLAADIPMKSDLTLRSGHPLILKQVNGMDISVILFTFVDPKCEDQSLETEMILFNPEPEDTSDDKSVGMKYDVNCEINVFVEAKNYYDKSIFR
jgi:hypothetical protein